MVLWALYCCIFCSRFSDTMSAVEGAAALAAPVSIDTIKVADHASWMYPITGHLFEVLPAAKSLRHPYYWHRVMIIDGDNEDAVMASLPGIRRIVMVKSPEIWREVAMRRKSFVLSDDIKLTFCEFNEGLLSMDGPEWQKRRRAATKAFQPANLRIVGSSAESLFTAWVAGNRTLGPGQALSFEPCYVFRSIMLDIAGRALLGKDMQGVVNCITYGNQAREADEARASVDLLQAIDDLLVGLMDISTYKGTGLRSLLVPAARISAYEKGAAALKAFAREQLTECVNKRKAQAGKARTEAQETKLLVDHLLDALEEEEEGLEFDAIVAVLVDLIFGSTDTSSHGLSFVVLVLVLDCAGLLHPDIMQMNRHLPPFAPGTRSCDLSFLDIPKPTLQAAAEAYPTARSEKGRIWARMEEEIKTVFGSLDASVPLSPETLSKPWVTLPYIHAVITETLRLFNVVAFTNRKADHDTTLGNGRWTVPKDTMVASVNYGMHTDPALYPRPWEIIPERWLPGAPADVAPTAGSPHQHHEASAFLAFGAGPKGCVGMRAAYVQMCSILVRLVQNFSSVSVDLRVARCPELKTAITAALINPLHVTGTLRK